MSTDAAGNTLTFMGLQTTCLDLARFGYLMLQGGTWDGEQVVSADFVEQATAVSSTELNAGYGYLFWLNHRGRIGSPVARHLGRGRQRPSPTASSCPRPPRTSSGPSGSTTRWWP